MRTPAPALLLAIGAALLVSCGTPQALDRAPLRPLQLLHHSTVPNRIIYNESVVGGFSGIDRIDDSTYCVVSDDRSVHNAARFYLVSLHIDSSRFEDRPTAVVTMLAGDGRPYPEGGVDAEAIRYDARSRSLWWTSEGDEARGVAPSIREMKLDGSFVRELPLPQMFAFAPDGSHGPRANGAFEGLSLSADGSQLIVSTENVLKQDGPSISHSSSGPIRISFLDRSSGALVRQIGYVPERAYRSPADTIVSDNGVVEVLARDDNHLLVLERGYSADTGNFVRLYEADIGTAADISRIDALQGMTIRPADKRLVFDFGILGPDLLDNIEGICWGPTLPDGRRTLVAVSDDNFNAHQLTKFYVLVEEHVRERLAP